MFSIVMPLYNKEYSVIKSIGSVLEQIIEDYELIIVNDGSTDSSLSVVNGIKDHRIRIIDIENRGVSGARNIGISYAKYDLIALIDADDIWLPNFLLEMANLINEFPLASLYGSTSTMMQNGQITSLDYGLAQGFRGYIDNYFDLDKYNTLFDSSSVVFRKKDFFDIGGYDENLKIGEDIDLWFRFAIKYKIAFINKTLTYYILESENRSSKKQIDGQYSLVNNLEKYKEYELTRPDFKLFLDTWRLYNIIEFYEGKRNIFVNVNKVLNEISNRNLSKFWLLVRFCPNFIRKNLFKLKKKL